MQLPGVETRVMADAEGVAAAAAEFISQQSRLALAKRGAFHLVLAGGGTPEAAYRLMAKSGHDWSNWHFYFGDERCLPVDHAQRNSQMASRAWFAPAGIAPARVAVIPADIGPEVAAAAYAHRIAGALPFDLVLLGIGEDGHTASLFPGRHAPDQDLAMAVFDAPKPPPERVSLTPKALGATRRMLVLVTGRAKHPALLAWQSGQPLPIARVACDADTVVLLDAAAAGG